MIFFISANVVHTLIKNTYYQTFVLLALQWSRWKDFLPFDLTFFYMEIENYPIAWSKKFFFFQKIFKCVTIRFTYNWVIYTTIQYHSNCYYDNDYVYDNRGAFIEGFDCLFITKRIHILTLFIIAFLLFYDDFIQVDYNRLLSNESTIFSNGSTNVLHRNWKLWVIFVIWLNCAIR